MPSVSLCLIAANEAGVIERCLQSFAPAFDELCLVRAIGAQAPDDTLQRAETWCQSAGKLFRSGEYRNAPAHADWPHVDDFAAARTAAFSLASGDWILWADCDDIASADIAEIRAIAAASPPDAVHLFPYHVTGTGRQPPRERLIPRCALAAGARWQWAIHENLVIPDGFRLWRHHAPAWLHRPTHQQKTSRERNLRILGAQLRDCPQYLFYWHQEFVSLGRAADARRSAELVMQMPNTPASFRYAAALALCRLTPDNDAALRHALAAHEIFPWCREAVAEILKIYLELGSRNYVAHWLDRLLALPEPSENLRPLTHEAKWYGWAARDLAARAARWLGDDARAAEIAATAPPPLVTLLHHPGKSAQESIRIREAWLDRAADPERVEHFFVATAPPPALAGFAFGTAADAHGQRIREIDDAAAPPLAWDELDIPR